jgi:hypothetical protein
VILPHRLRLSRMVCVRQTGRNLSLVYTHISTAETDNYGKQDWNLLPGLIQVRGAVVFEGAIQTNTARRLRNLRDPLCLVSLVTSGGPGHFTNLRNTGTWMPEDEMQVQAVQARSTYRRQYRTCILL